ncbi:L-aspartate oxidase [Maricaulis sp.]|uniref:L-aspartate oxidase n=1 Tax=Maricaulis sp. TaxID=1486257 RepID=UPI003A94DB6B
MTRPVLIIGAGIAGLWAALKLAPRRVILLTGSPLGEGAASGWAQGGVSAALAEDDTPALHARDTIEAGAGLVDTEAAHALAAGAAEQVRELAAIGAPFEREGEAWSLSREAAHSRHRVARVTGDGAGAAIMQTLIAAVRAASHVEIRDGWSAAALIPAEDGGCAGAIARSPTGETVEILAEETVLAMGGAGGLFALTTTPAGAQGQAMAMAARLGAEIQDPEFIQFHPTALNAGLDPAPLCTEALRGDGATLIDRAGHRFMKAIHRDAELAPRDVVARAVHRHNQGGKGAFLDCRCAIGDTFPVHFPAVFAACMSAGIDPRVEPIPVAPTAHYHMGGVAADIDGQTSVPGLWAIGECASTGLHGANRLASNSLAEGLVSAARVAKVLTDASLRATDRAPAVKPAHIPPALPPLALTRLRQAMSRYCGVERSGAGLAELSALIEAMIARHGEADALIAARFITAGAIARTESRGGHFRTDFPKARATARHTRLSLADLADTRPHALAHTAPAE